MKNRTFLTLLFWASLTTLFAQPLSGDYTINSALPTGGNNFQSFTDLAAALNANGISGNVTATVEPGSGPYQEQVVFSNITGSGPSATITLDGSGETITAVTSGAARHVVRLANCQYFTIRNLHVDWDPASTGGFYAIHIFGSGSHITIENCHADLTGTTSTLYGAYIASGSETSILEAGNFNNISILNNFATGGGYGASVFGLASPLATQIEIAHNQFLNAHSNAIYIRETDGVDIHHNFIDKTTSNVTSWNAIQIAQSANINARIYNNYIQVSQTSNGTQTFRGIYLFNGVGHKVYNNVITNIQLESGNVNAIEVRTGGTAPEIYFNTISIDKAASTSGNLSGIIESLSNTNSKLRNNVISISQPCTGFKAGLSLATNSVPPTALNSDYNVIYVPGGNVAQKGSSISGYTFYPTLSDWQNVSNQDQNSYSVDPAFESPILPRPTNFAIDDKGTPITGITLDYLGINRGAIPDIGAFEFGGCPPPNAPDEIFGETEFCVNTTGVSFSIDPVGGAIDYHWTVPANASIASGQGTTSITVDFGATSGNITVAVEDSCGIGAPALLPVSLINTPPAPGAVTGPTGICANAGPVTLTIPAVSGATSYTWTIPLGATLISGQGTTTLIIDFGINSGTVAVTADNDCGSSAPTTLAVEVFPPTSVTLDIPADTLCLNAGPYTLTGGNPVDGVYSGPGVSNGIFDPETAGIGIHTLTLTYEDEFGCVFSASDDIVVDACAGLFDLRGQTTQLVVSPNPTPGQITIQPMEWQEWEIRVLDQTGRLVATHFNTWNLDLSQQPSGMYFLVVHSKGKIAVARVMKQ